jgi:hypothetical protein
MEALLLDLILLVSVAGAQMCQVEIVYFHFVLGEPCTYQLPNSSYGVNVTVSDPTNITCNWRWRADNLTTFNQREPGFGVGGNHFWFLTSEEILARATQEFAIRCRQIASLGPITFLFFAADTDVSPSSVAPSPTRGEGLTSVPPNATIPIRPGGVLPNDNEDDGCKSITIGMAVPFAVSVLVASICTVAFIIATWRLAVERRGRHTVESEDEGQGASHGSPVYLPLPPAPLPGSAIRDRSRQLPSAELRHSEQETDEDDADTTPDQIPLIPMPPSAQREESGASTVCGSPRRSSAGSPSVVRRSPSREVPSPGREVPATEVESSLQLASIDNPRCAETMDGTEPLSQQ